MRKSFGTSCLLVSRSALRTDASHALKAIAQLAWMFLLVVQDPWELAGHKPDSALLVI